MAKRNRSVSQKYSAPDNKMLMVIVLLVVGFAAGFLVARFKYKAQLTRTYDMVMDRETRISDLKSQIDSYQQKMMIDKNK